MLGTLRNRVPVSMFSQFTITTCFKCQLRSLPPVVWQGVNNHIPPDRKIMSLVEARRSFHSTPLQDGIFSPKDNVTFMGRVLTKLGFTDIPKSVLKMSGYFMYMKIADEVDYKKFFENCNLPDTYASWFTVVELHVWLLAARLMQNEKEGRIVRNSLIKAMWEDTDIKSKSLEGALTSARKREIRVLNDQFHAVMFSYDEGLLGSDYILAGALWRRFLQNDKDPKGLDPQNFVGPEHEALAKKVKALEMLVIYVRSQFYMLNNLSREQLIRKRAFQWAPFDDSLFDLTAKFERMPTSRKQAASM